MWNLLNIFGVPMCQIVDVSKFQKIGAHFPRFSEGTVNLSSKIAEKQGLCLKFRCFIEDVTVPALHVPFVGYGFVDF